MKNETVKIIPELVSINVSILNQTIHAISDILRSPNNREIKKKLITLRENIIRQLPGSLQEYISIDDLNKGWLRK